MSLFGAMNTAISGLSAQSAAFSNIGDNVANSQTIGFKRIDTSFENYLTTSTANENRSGAVVSRPDYVNTVQGTVSQTDNPLDLAITGQGFFTVSRQTGESKGQPVFNPLPQYSRTGDFKLNNDGYLVNSSSGFLNGWIADSSGRLDQTSTAPIQVGQSGYSPVATTSATLAANLPATPGSDPIVTEISVFDALGQSQKLELTWTPETGVDNTWNVSVGQKGAATALGVAKVAFGVAGNAAAPEGTVGSITTVSGSVTGSTFSVGGSATLGITADFGSGPQSIALNLGTFGQSNGMTQYAGTEYTLRGLTQNGVAPGSFNGVAMKANGDVVVNYDNGQSRVVARVPLTTFANPDALQRQDGQAFTATRESGAGQTVQAGTTGAGNLVVSATEGSNVDIAKEFTKLIVAQRAYSANTKMVTTADELLQQTIDLKR